MSKTLAPETRKAVIKAVRAGFAPFSTGDRAPLSVWAQENFQMDEESSHKRGGWECWPFQIGWMDAFSNDSIVEVNVEKAKRVGYTKTVVAFSAYCAAHTRRKIGIYQPTDDDRDSFVKSEIQPAFDICKAIDPVRRSGVDSDTMRFKRFRGSVQHYLGAKAARNFRRITLAVAVLDEIDAMEQIVEKTIDPYTGAYGRLEGAPFPKIVIGTTPRIKGLSHVRRRSDAADAVMRYQITCPKCGVDHPLTWGGKESAHGFKWDGMDAKTSPATVRHVCPHCRESITQADYSSVWWDGYWADDKGQYTYRHRPERQWRDATGMPCKPPRHVAFVGIWAAYSPQRTWADIVREFLEARVSQKAGDNGPMQGFVNETLADVWEEEFEQTDAAVLRQRAMLDTDIPLQTVPDGAAKVLMFIDVQGDRWEATAWAVGKGREMWPIDHRVIYGNLALQSEWGAKLDPVLDTVYTNVHGCKMKLDAVGIDTGGNFTHQAYNFVRDRESYRPIYATKGEGALGEPIKMRPTKVDVNAKGRTIKKGLKLWRICVDTAKDLLHGMLDKVKTPGPGYVHLNRHLEPAWFDQLVAERRVPVMTARGREWRWQCPQGARNEALDCAVGCIFLMEVLQLGSQTDATWEKWLAALRPEPESSRPPPKPAAVVKPPARPAGLGSSDWSTRL